MPVIFKNTLFHLILLGAETVFQIILKWFLGKDGNFNSIHLSDTDLVALGIYIFEGIGRKVCSQVLS